MSIDTLRSDLEHTIQEATKRIAALDHLQKCKIAMDGLGFETAAFERNGMLVLETYASGMVDLPVRPVHLPATPQEAVIEAQAAPECLARPEAADKGDWTNAEDMKILEIQSKGGNTRDMAAAIGRPWQTIVARLRVLNEAEAEDPAPQTPPEPEEERSGPANWYLLDHSVLSHRERAADIRVREAGNPEPFTPKLDLDIAEALARGEKAGNVAALLEIDKAALVERWNRLLPYKSSDEQAALLTVLRSRLQALATQ